MPTFNQQFQTGGYYHIYHRGGDRQKILFEEENYLHFLRLINKYRNKFAMNVVAYCLMPNHFHFMLQPQNSDTLSQFMGKLQQSYVQAINKRSQRRGPLFSDRFQHVHVHSERYQILLCRYIHVNPKKDGIVTELEEWAYSNYLEFIEARKGVLYVPGFRERYFKTAKEYEEFVAKYGTDEDDDLEKFLFGSN